VNRAAGAADRVCAGGGDRLGDEGRETLVAVRVEVRQQLAPHARLPELAHVAGGVAQCLRAVRHGLEEVADAVGHAEQVVSVHDVLRPAFRRRCR
jgi:2-C-methyl-D-erythritol 4-phosphate cytidylyltransferase